MQPSNASCCTVQKVPISVDVYLNSVYRNHGTILKKGLIAFARIVLHESFPPMLLNQYSVLEMHLSGDELHQRPDVLPTQPAFSQTSKFWQSTLSIPGAFCRIYFRIQFRIHVSRLGARVSGEDICARFKVSPVPCVSVSPMPSVKCLLLRYLIFFSLLDRINASTKTRCP